MATQDWNSSYEAIPADGDNISEGANRIRNLKRDVRERIEKDHYMDVAGTQADHGEHSKVTFNAPITTPTNVANKGFLYTKDVSGKAELHFEDEDGNEIQLTYVGAINVPTEIPTGTKMVFYQSAAPTGWTQDTSLNDYMLRVVSGAGGGSGGTISPITMSHTHSDTLAAPDHTHTLATSGTTNSDVTLKIGVSGGFLRQNGATSVSAATSTTGNPTATALTGSVSNATFVPKYADLIICSKDA